MGNPLLVEFKLRKVLVNLRKKLKALLPGEREKEIEAFVDKVLHFGSGFYNLEFAGFDFGHIEKVTDEFKHGFRRGFD